MPQVIEEFSEDAKVFLLGLFADNCGYARSDLSQMRVLWHFFGRFATAKPNMPYDECNRLSILAAYLFDVLGVKNPVIKRAFERDRFIDLAFMKLKNAGRFDSYLKDAKTMHVNVGKGGNTSLAAIH